MEYTDTDKAFLAAIEHNWSGYTIATGPSPGCADCGLEHIEDMEHPDYEAASESSFSWRECESCGSTLGV